MSLRAEWQNIDPHVLASTAVNLLKHIDSPEGVPPSEKFRDYPELLKAIGTMTIACEEAGISEGKASMLIGGLVLLVDYVDVTETEERFGHRSSNHNQNQINF